MDKKRNLSLYQKLHWLSLFIGMCTIIVPILFWKRIPDQIPTHYNGAGVIDHYGEKSTLVLLFFAIVMLMGMMSIVVYFIKMNMESSSSSEYQRSEMEIVYPMIILMNLALQLVFAYIMFCCVSGRALGLFFTPIALIGTFAPLVYMIYKCAKLSGNSSTDQVELRMLEKTEKGTVYRSAVDWWLGLILICALLMVVWFAIEPMIEEGRMDWFSFVIMILVTIIIVPLFQIKYVLYEEHMLISMGFYGKVRIKYQDITKMQKTFNPLSSAALSLKRIQIDYVENGMHRMILISPKNRDEFMKILVEKRESCKV